MVSERTPISRAVGDGVCAHGGAACPGVNVGETDQLLSAASGGLLVWLGLKQGGMLGAGLAATGGCLIYRGLSGHCALYAAAGRNTAEVHSPQASVAAGRGIKVVQAIAVQASAEDLFHISRNFENLPRFMAQSCPRQDARQSFALGRPRPSRHRDRLGRGDHHRGSGPNARLALARRLAGEYRRLGPFHADHRRRRHRSRRYAQVRSTRRQARLLAGGALWPRCRTTNPRRLATLQANGRGRRDCPLCGAVAAVLSTAIRRDERTVITKAAGRWALPGGFSCCLWTSLVGGC